MQLVIHDYSGHPGQVHLSRELARRGHRVEHQFCASFTTGRGAVVRRGDDPATFSVRPLKLKRQFARYSPVVRVLQEIEYGRIAARAIADFRPDVAVLSNVPLLSLFPISIAMRLKRIPHVLWHQDVYSVVIKSVATQRLGRAGSIVGWLADKFERFIAHGAVAIVPISDSFTEQLDRWNVPPAKVRVIPNWGAVDEMPLRPKDNSWSRSHGLADVPVVMYAGTLGLKHDPSVLVQLARDLPLDVCLAVVSQGKGRQWLEAQAPETPNLKLLDYQPYDDLPDMLGAADVLLAVLESDASRYSVPSKVLNYLCAGRPVLGILPADNAAAQMIVSSRAGLVVGPGDARAASAALNDLLRDPEARATMGDAARNFAEKTFDVTVVADEFESVISTACGFSHSDSRQ